jgi:tetratricopeptide (TPR) repeat protein
MITHTRWIRDLRRPLAILALAMVVAVGSQVAAAARGSDAGPEPVTPGAITDLQDPPAPPAGLRDSDLERIRANIDFWSARAEADPRDFVSATRWAVSEIDLARSTGDVTRYLAADVALDRALSAHAGYRPAAAYRGVVLIALHRFTEARDAALDLLAGDADDAVALATFGDASLELGDVPAARRAYEHLSVVADSAAARVRRSHLAFIEGDTIGAVTAARAAVDMAQDEGHTGGAMAWFWFQLGEALAATGDVAGAALAYAMAGTDDPGSHLAHWGLARVAAATARWDDAIGHLDAAIAVIPLPDFVARRADLYRLRGSDGDVRRERDDRATVLAIASLAGDASGVYDRTLSLYLASHGEPERALGLAEAEISVRRDVYGYDALAWALLANGRVEEARATMTKALAFGTRDAKLLYHAGRIELAAGDDVTGRYLLDAALVLDPSFDPLAVREIRGILGTEP